MTTTLASNGLASLRVSDDSQPDWLVTIRESAATWIAEHGFPTRAHEDWKYVRLAAVLDAAVSPACPPLAEPPSATVLDALVPDLQGIRLFFVDGHLAADLSSVPSVPSVPSAPSAPSASSASSPSQPIVVEGVASVLSTDPDRVSGLFGVVDRAHRDGFAALNVALAEDGAFVVVPDDVVVDRPIHLVFCTTGGAMSSPRSTIDVGRNSRVTIVESHVGLGRGVSCTNAVIEVSLAAGAHVEHHVLQDMPLAAFHFDMVDVVLATGSSYSSQVFSVGGAIARHEVRVLLEGDHAETTLAGLFIPAGDQYHDHPVLVEHRGANGTSTQRYHGVLDDHGHGVFNGRIVVQPSAHGTDATQVNKNLILSDHAEIDTRPRLEILADDVMCSHGATVGQLDPEAVHYLRTRGIDEAMARGMLTAAFANEMVGQITLAPLHDWIERLVGDRLHHVAELT